MYFVRLRYLADFSLYSLEVELSNYVRIRIHET